MKKTIIASSNAPKAASFFSQAILTSSKYKMEISGQVGLVPERGSLIEGGLAAETEQAFRNIKNILAEAGWNFNNITKVRIFLLTMSDYKEMNETYSKYFIHNSPARICVAVKELPLGALVEIECCAEGDEVKIKN